MLNEDHGMWYRNYTNVNEVVPLLNYALHRGQRGWGMYRYTIVTRHELQSIVYQAITDLTWSVAWQCGSCLKNFHCRMAAHARCWYHIQKSVEVMQELMSSEMYFDAGAASSFFAVHSPLTSSKTSGDNSNSRHT
jgi:hypothetical protein